MPTCDKCGSEDHGDLFYGIYSVCRKKMRSSLPTINKAQNSIQTTRKTQIPPQKLILKIKNNMERSKLGAVSLILDLIALLAMIIYFNT